MTTIHDAAETFRRAIANGLMSYPRNQIIRADGSPDPMLRKTRDQRASRVTYCEVRAYLLSETGTTVEQIAKIMGSRSSGSLPW